MRVLLNNSSILRCLPSIARHLSLYSTLQRPTFAAMAPHQTGKKRKNEDVAEGARYGA